MIPAVLKDLSTSRIVSAAGALVMTTVILLAIGLGFSPPARAVALPAAALPSSWAAPAAGALEES